MYHRRWTHRRWTEAASNDLPWAQQFRSRLKQVLSFQLRDPSTSYFSGPSGDPYGKVLPMRHPVTGHRIFLVPAPDNSVSLLTPLADSLRARRRRRRHFVLVGPNQRTHQSLWESDFEDLSQDEDDDRSSTWGGSETPSRAPSPSRFTSASSSAGRQVRTPLVAASSLEGHTARITQVLLLEDPRTGEPQIVTASLDQTSRLWRPFHTRGGAAGGGEPPIHQRPVKTFRGHTGTPLQNAVPCRGLSR